MDHTPPAARSLAHTIRRWVVGVIIVSFSIAALGGIVVLLSGSWSETAGNVLATTALTGIFSVAVLCGIALAARAAQWFGWLTFVSRAATWFGWLTVVVSIVTLALLLMQLWGDYRWSDILFELDVTLCVITAALAVSSLLLLLVSHHRQSVRAFLYVTLGLIAIGVILSLVPVWNTDVEDEVVLALDGRRLDPRRARHRHRAGDLPADARTASCRGRAGSRASDRGRGRGRARSPFGRLGRTHRERGSSRGHHLR